METAATPFRIPGFRDNRLLHGLMLWLACLWTVAAIAPFDRHDWLLENLLVFFYTGLLAITYRRFAFSNRSYALFTVFLSLHLVGAHYTYAETPLGFWLQDGFGFGRNHYDRIVHFGFGLLCVYPFYEILLRVAQVRPAWARFLAASLILAFSAFYEIIEAVVAVVVSPELGMAYLGTQGDEWDAQKDSALAFAGAIVMMLALRLTYRPAPA